MLRDGAARLEGVTTLIATTPHPGSRAWTRLIATRLAGAIARAPEAFTERQRLAYDAYWKRGRTAIAAAEELGVTPGALRERLRALRRAADRVLRDASRGGRP